MEHITEFNGKTIAKVIAFKPSSVHYEFNAIQFHFTDGTYIDVHSVGEYGQGSSIEWASGEDSSASLRDTLSPSIALPGPRP